LWVAASQVAEKVISVVIPSAARDLLLRNYREKQIPRANPALGMTIFVFFRKLFSRGIQNPGNAGLHLLTADGVQMPTKCSSQSSVTVAVLAPDIPLASRPVFDIVIQLLVTFQKGSARQRPRTLAATGTFPLLRGDLRARSDSN
jgi:hypothetical protein